MTTMLEKIDEYYTGKLKKYGTTPMGVDWSDEKTQFLRFEQLIKLISGEGEKFRVFDIGCGYGKLYEYISCHFDEFDYYGYDLSSKMIENANNLFGNKPNVFFHKIDNVKSIINPADYSIVSGIFNVKLTYTDNEWLSYILETLEKLDDISIKGFAFNILTSYSDKEYMRDDLYYADPLFFFDFCKKNFSKKVALLHDYDLYEFTILVRKV